MPPKRQQKSSLASKLGAEGKKAYDQFKDDPAEVPGGGSLPEGIDGGIAQIENCYFGQYKDGEFKGEYFFRASATVISPKTHNGIPVKGRTTSVMEPLCKTPKKSRKTIKEHLAHILNLMKLMGAEDEVANSSADDLEKIAADIAEAQPLIQFRTWKGKPTKAFPNPRVQETWEGTVDPDDVELEDDDRVDEEVEDEEEEGAEEEEGEEEEEEGGDEEEVDIDELVRAATEDEDEDAQAQLAQMAIDAGNSEDDVNAKETWEEVAAMIDGGEGEEEEGGEDDEPQKGDTWKYKPPRARRPVEVEITSVSRSKQTVNCKHGNKTYKAVPWDKLS